MSVHKILVAARSPEQAQRRAEAASLRVVMIRLYERECIGLAKTIRLWEVTFLS